MPNKTDYTFDVQTWPGGSWAVKAKAPDGQVIGDAVGDTLEDETGPARLYEQREVWVDPEHRRRGVATGMIRALEKATKIRFRPTGEFTPEGRKWWNSMRRKNPSQPKKPRASEQDMLDAIQHADLNGDQGWTLADFNILPMGETPLSRIRGYEDWGAWIDVAPEDFAGMSTEERLKELESFRGPKWAARAREWLEHGVPPVVVIDAPIVDENHLHRQIGDGRGRINFALAMGLKTLPVVIMKWKHALPGETNMPRKNPQTQPLPALTREPGPARPNMAGEVKQTSKNPARFAVWDGEGWPWSVQWPSVYPGTPDDPDADYGAEDALKRVDAAEREHARRKLGLGLSARKALRKKNPRSSDYQGTHLPPGPEDGAPAHDVENMMPDYYAHPEWYFAGGRGPADHEAARILRSVRGRPWAPVWVYRAVPKGVDVLAINPGDWVTTVRAYATEHAEASLGGRGKSHILKAKVRAGELFNEGNSHFEFGWWPASDEQAKTWQAARRETPGYKASAAKVRQNPSETHGPSCAGGMHKAPGGWVEIGDCLPAPRMRRNPKGPALVGKLVTPEACFNLAAEAFRKVGIAVEEYHKTATSHVVGMDKGNVWYEPSRRGALWMGHVAPASLKLKFTPGGARHAGLCRWHNVFRTLEIQLNKAAWGGFDDDYRADTILHEVAHAIQFVLQGKSDHGPEWKRIAQFIGCSGEACVTGDKAVAMRKAVAKAKGLPEPLGLRLADIEVGDEVAFVNKKKVVRGTVTRKVPPDARERAALRGGYVLFRVPVGPDFPQGATGKLSAELVVEHKRPGA